jgi:hypothetical protein
VRDGSEKFFYVFEKGDPALRDDQDAKLSVSVSEPGRPTTDFILEWRAGSQQATVLDASWEYMAGLRSVPEFGREVNSLSDTATVREWTAALSRAGFQEREHDYQRQRRERSMQIVKTPQRSYGRDNWRERDPDRER